MRAGYSATVKVMQNRCAAHAATRNEGFGHGWPERGNGADYEEKEARDSTEARTGTLRFADLPLGVLRLVTYGEDSLSILPQKCFLTLS